MKTNPANKDFTSEDFAGRNSNQVRSVICKLTPNKVKNKKQHLDVKVCQERPLRIQKII